MHILVAHHLWRFGGETRFNLDLASALCRLGYRVSIVSVSKPIKAIENELAALDCIENKYYIIPISLQLFALYQRLMLYRAVRKALKNTKIDLLWIDSNTYKPLINSRSSSYRIVEYIHFPLELLNQRTINQLPDILRKEVTSYFSKYLESRKWKLYLKLLSLVQKRVQRDNPFTSADLVLANSRYTGELVYHLWGEKPYILYPPVTIEDFKHKAHKGYEERDASIIMIGRISKEKRYEIVIKAITHTDTKPRLRIVGSLAPSAKSYLQKLKKLARNNNITLEIHTNVSREKLVQLATQSRIFVHATIGEHFGIAVVEAMAAGLPVIVHMSGGPFHDIIEKGKYGYYYKTVEELAHHIDKLLSSKREWNHYHKLSLERASNFSFANFVKRLEVLLSFIQT
ncbi:glycosyltransferase [Hyperthermus butylicus]|uniref:Glycosyltransferase n=1 Tax=Hyperthermus butylicus (strain DSM 5456 / JCM 9403 / PLM1-5) TaxID=415426 RepID=A2BMW5_HYPBU|nr:glycosyltransferase [Hyperthermus butylicus]ABM81326.1 putative glycosyltransferase [Hyperthermus butylicus DSM 5456]